MEGDQKPSSGQGGGSSSSEESSDLIAMENQKLKQMVSLLEKKAAANHDKLRKATVHLEAVVMDNKELNNRLAQVSHEHEQANLENKSMSEKISNLQNTVNEYERHSKKGTFLSKFAIKADAESMVAEENLQLQRKVVDLQAKVKNYNKIEKDLITAKEDLVSKLEMIIAVKAQNSELSTAVFGLEERLEELQMEFDFLEAEKTGLNEKANGLERRLQIKQKLVDTLEEVKKESSEKVLGLERSLDNVQSEASVLKSECQNQTQLVESLRADNDSLRTKLQSIKGNLARAAETQNEAAALKSQYQNQTQVVESLRLENASLKARLVSAEQNLVRATNTQDEAATWKSKYQNQTQIIESLRSDNTSLKRSLTSTEENVSRAMIKMGGMEQEHRQQLARIRERDIVIEGLKASIEQYKEDLNDGCAEGATKALWKEAEARAQLYKEKLDIMTEKVQRLAEEKIDMHRELGELEKVVAMHEQAQRENITVMSGKEKLLRDVQAQLEACKAEITRSNATVDTLEKDKVLLLRQTKDVEERNETLCDEKNSALRHKEDQIEAYKNETRDTESKIQSILAENSSILEKLKESEKRVESAKMERSAQIQNYKRQLDSAGSKIKTLENEHKVLVLKLEETGLKARDNEKLLVETMVSLVEYRKAREKLAVSRKSLEMSLKGIQDGGQSAKGEPTGPMRVRRDVSSEDRVLDMAVSGTPSSILAQVAKEKEMLSMEREALEASLKEVREAMDNVSKENAALKSQLASQEHDLWLANKELQGIRANSDRMKVSLETAESELQTKRETLHLSLQTAEYDLRKQLEAKELELQELHLKIQTTESEQAQLQAKAKKENMGLKRTVKKLKTHLSEATREVGRAVIAKKLYEDFWKDAKVEVDKLHKTTSSASLRPTTKPGPAPPHSARSPSRADKISLLAE